MLALLLAVGAVAARNLIDRAPAPAEMPPRRPPARRWWPLWPPLTPAATDEPTAIPATTNADEAAPAGRYDRALSRPSLPPVPRRRPRPTPTARPPTSAAYRRRRRSSRWCGSSSIWSICAVGRVWALPRWAAWPAANCWRSWPATMTRPICGIWWSPPTSVLAGSPRKWCRSPRWRRSRTCRWRRRFRPPPSSCPQPR